MTPKTDWKNISIEIGGISRKDIQFFTKHLSIALRHGLTLQDGLEMLEEESTSKKMKAMLGFLMENIKSGKPFYEGLEKYPRYFSSMYVNLVKTGELAGTLEENLGHLAEELKKAEELRQKIKSAMMYPTLIFVAIIGLGFSVAVFILPKILPLFESLDVTLPLSTRILIDLAELFSEHGVSASVGMFVFLVLFFWLIRRDFTKPFTHRLLLKMPVAGPIIKNIQVERFSRTLGTLLKSGVTLDKGLQVTADATGNRVYKKTIESLIAEVEKGRGIAEGMGRHPELFSKITSRMVGMGEKTGSLESTLKYISEMTGDEIDNTMKNLSTILEPFMLIFIGLVVGFVAISILGPIYKITGNVNV